MINFNVQNLNLIAHAFTEKFVFCIKVFAIVAFELIRSVFCKVQHVLPSCKTVHKVRENSTTLICVARPAGRPKPAMVLTMRLGGHRWRLGGCCHGSTVTSLARLHGRRELHQPGVLCCVHDNVDQVAPHVPDAGVLGTDLLNGGWTLGTTGSRWVTTFQDLQQGR